MKTKLANLSIAITTRQLALLFGVFLLLASISIPFARADRFSNQITELQEENHEAHEKVDALRLRAESIEEAIAKLQATVDALQQKIVENQAKSDQLKAEIAEAEIELAKQRDVLGQNIKAMYLEGQITTLEMLATSKDLSQFVDKQQYRDVVKSKIKDQVDTITALRLELQANREEVEALLKEDRKLKVEISEQKAEQDRLLAMNMSEQAEFNAKIRENNKKIDQLLAAQNELARKLASGVFVSLGPIRQGDVIGSVGNTGYSDGAHLHLEARSSGGLLNPNDYLGKSWIYPVEPVRVTQDYNEYNPVYISGRHPGIDFGGPGAPVRAVADGQIISRGCSADSSFFGQGNTAYGYAVVIQHNDGKFSVYAHMIPPSSGFEHCNYSTY